MIIISFKHRDIRHFESEREPYDDAEPYRLTYPYSFDVNVDRPAFIVIVKDWVTEVVGYENATWDHDFYSVIGQYKVGSDQHRSGQVSQYCRMWVADMARSYNEKIYQVFNGRFEMSDTLLDPDDLSLGQRDMCNDLVRIAQDRHKTMYDVANLLGSYTGCQVIWKPQLSQLIPSKIDDSLPSHILP